MANAADGGSLTFYSTTDYMDPFCIYYRLYDTSQTRRWAEQQSKSVLQNFSHTAQRVEIKNSEKKEEFQRRVFLLTLLHCIIIISSSILYYIYLKIYKPLLFKAWQVSYTDLLH